MIVHGKKMLFYYAGARYNHGSRNVPLDRRQLRIGLERVPQDRLMGLGSRERLEGKRVFLTRPIVVEGDELVDSAQVGEELRVNVVDPTARQFDTGKKVHMSHYIGVAEHEVDGSRRKVCDMIRGDGLHQVTWKGRSLAALKGRAVRLQFLFRDATIWAFQVADTRQSVR